MRYLTQLQKSQKRREHYETQKVCQFFISRSVFGPGTKRPGQRHLVRDGVTDSDSSDCKSATTACKTIGHAISLEARFAGRFESQHCEITQQHFST
jgi:hypothetical protein